MARILLVEDDKELSLATSAFLREEGHNVVTAADVEEGRRGLSDFAPEIVITDLMLGQGSGLDILKEARRRAPAPEVILVTAHAASHTAAQAMRQGAYEYINKPYSLAEIANIVRRIAARRVLVGGAAQARPAAGQRLVAESAAMQRVLEMAGDAAGTTTTVLLRGESGTGKEEVAMFIHERSPRSGGRFVAVNCGAIPENLLASELFGHEKGAFTGAAARKPGAFEQADHGSLLLDEIGDVSPATQVHLLRALETRDVTRVGGTAAIPVDVRLIASTHRDLEALIRRGDFREDFYYRINVYPIVIPPLRERREDIPPLVGHFLEQSGNDAGRIDSAALEALRAYDWPGNIRELRNITENLLIRSKGECITPALVKSVLPSGPIRPPEPAHPETLQESETRRIREALQSTAGNKAAAARLLGISRRRMYSRMKILGIEG